MPRPWTYPVWLAVVSSLGLLSLSLDSEKSTFFPPDASRINSFAVLGLEVVPSSLFLVRLRINQADRFLSGKVLYWFVDDVKRCHSKFSC